MAASKIIVGFVLAGTLAACGGQTPAPADAASAGEIDTAPTAATQADAPPTAGSLASTIATGAAPTAAGPLDGLWRCKIIGDIPIGTLTFTGGSYVFQTTNTAWEPNPNPSDGAGTVTFNENFVLPETGPLKDEFEVTGAFGDGSFINFNNNLGMLFGCRRP